MKIKLLVSATTFALLTGNSIALTPFSDNFNAASLKKSRWALTNHGKGELVLGNKRLNFIVQGKPTTDDYSILELKNNRPGYNESWEIIVDVSNSANLQKTDYDFGVGFLIFNAADRKDVAAFEFYGKSGLAAVTLTDDKENRAFDPAKKPKMTSGSMRISFDKSSKLISFWYDATGSANGFKWKRVGTFSPTGKGGDRRGNWKLNPGSGSFGIQLFGFGELGSVSNGTMSLDNFILRGMK